MYAVGVEFHLTGMADAAVDRCRDRLTGSVEGGTDLGVALRAGGSRMTRGVVRLLIHEERNSFTVPDHSEVGIVMTAETVTIRSTGFVEYIPDFVG